MGGAFEHLDTVGSRQLAHTLTFALLLASFSSMLTVVALRTPAKRVSLPCLPRWAPFLGLCLACLLVMIDPTRHVFLDAGLYVGTLRMFHPDGSLTPAGNIGKYGAWLGNFLLFVSMLCFVLPASAGASEEVAHVSGAALDSEDERA
eukprot:gb/GFBE01047935.1/.p1 GENE.gb/GFBE01047935.1/~~gb/GFBE01047935.1/.p1  ORF type:complete len:147 (+),score=16.98 gb/GFBE01047935.1/:1-441(+)